MLLGADKDEWRSTASWRLMILWARYSALAYMHLFAPDERPYFFWPYFASVGHERERERKAMQTRVNCCEQIYDDEDERRFSRPTEFVCAAGGAWPAARSAAADQDKKGGWLFSSLALLFSALVWFCARACTLHYVLRPARLSRAPKLAISGARDGRR